MYDFKGFAEDKEYLYKNMHDRYSIKMNKMPVRCSRKSKAGAYGRSQKYHYIKPMMSRHGDMIRLVLGLTRWTKKADDRILFAIDTIASCHYASVGHKYFPNANEVSDLAWALKDLYHANTSWDKLTVKLAFSSTSADMRYTDRRRLLNMIPKPIRVIKAWNSERVFSYNSYGVNANTDPEFAIKDHPINGEFVQSYKYRTFEDRRLAWFHSALAAEFVKNHRSDYGSRRTISTLDDNDAILFKKMSLVNDVKILGGWAKAMKELHPVGVGTGLVAAVKTFIADGTRMAIPNPFRQADERLVTIDYKTMSVLEMINASVNNHRIMAEQNRLLLERHDTHELDREMPTLALPDHLEELRIKTSKDMRKAGAECGHCIGSYSQDTHHIFFRKGNVCAMVSATNGNIVQCFDTNNKTTPASKKFQSYLTAEIKKADIPFLRTIKKKVIPAEYFNNEVRYDYPF